MDADSQELLASYRAGSPEAARELFDRYVDRLIGLARKRLPGRLARRVDPEDVVQSAYRTFFVEASQGRFALERTGDLWRLLAAITVNKVRRQVDRYGRKKRKLNEEESVGGTTDELHFPPEAVDREPLPDEAVAIAELVESVMTGLDPFERHVLELRLLRHTTPEIAALVDRTERTVQRVLRKIELQLEELLEASRGD